MAEGKQIQGSTAVSDKSGTEPPGAPAGRDKNADDESDASLGKFLSMTREGCGVTREDVVSQTRIPNHYLRMLENSDYSLISDQLYVLPFLRRYATYLGLDPEETAMRFVREVQRADNTPPIRMADPVQAHRKRHRGWAGMVAVIIAIAVIGWLYMLESEHHRAIANESAAPIAAVNAGASAATAPGSTPSNTAASGAGRAGAASASAGVGSAKPAVPASAAVPSP
ncbi:MAG: helix-turn-helix domain-containing protein [Candidatus Binataceae bacterium]